VWTSVVKTEDETECHTTLNENRENVWGQKRGLFKKWSYLVKHPDHAQLKNSSAVRHSWDVG